MIQSGKTGAPCRGRVVIERKNNLECLRSNYGDMPSGSLDSTLTTHSKPRLLGRSEAAAMLDMSRGQLDRLTKAGVLPVIHIDRRPRFLPEDIEAFIRSRRRTGDEAPLNAAQPPE